MHHHGERKVRVVSMDLGQVQYELTMQPKYTKMFKPCFPVQFPLPNPPYLVCEGNCGFRHKIICTEPSGVGRKGPTTLHFFDRQAPNPNMYSNYSNHKHQTSEKTTMTLQEK